MRDFSQPQRLSPASLVILIIEQTIRFPWFTMMWIVLISIVKDAPLWMFVVFCLLILLYVIVTAIVRHRKTRYWISDGKLHILEGLWSMRELNIPIERIHSLRQRSNWWYQLLDMTGLEIDGLASEQAEAILILEDTTADALKNYIIQQVEGQTQTQAVGNQAGKLEPTLQYSIGRIIIGTLTQSHIKSFTIIGAILYYIMDFVNERMNPILEKLAIDPKSAYSVTVQMLLQFQAEYATLGTIVLALLIAYIIGTIGVLIVAINQKWNGTLHAYPTRLVWKGGLTEQVTRQIRHAKTTMISIKQNPLERYLRIETAKIWQAHRALTVQTDGTNILTLPAIGDSTWLRRWWGIDREVLGTCLRSGYGLFLVKFCPIALLCLFLLGGVYLYDPAFASEVILPLFIPTIGISALWAWGIWKHRAIAASERYVAYYSGALAKEEHWLSIERIQFVQIRQTILQRRWGRCRLVIQTPAKKLSIEALKLHDAQKLAEYLTYRLELTAMQTHKYPPTTPKLEDETPEAIDVTTNNSREESHAV